MDPDVSHFEMRLEQALNVHTTVTLITTVLPTAPLAPASYDKEQLHLAGGGEGQVAERPARLVFASREHSGSRQSSVT